MEISTFSQRLVLIASLTFLLLALSQTTLAGHIQPQESVTSSPATTNVASTLAEPAGTFFGTLRVIWNSIRQCVVCPSGVGHGFCRLDLNCLIGRLCEQRILPPRLCRFWGF
jgi:hypothetical protein